MTNADPITEAETATAVAAPLLEARSLLRRPDKVAHSATSRNRLIRFTPWQ